MLELLILLLQFILFLPARLVCLLVVLLFSPIWIWFKETRIVYGGILLRLLCKLDIRGDSDEEHEIIF